jgi:hypothetical protein
MTDNIINEGDMTMDEIEKIYELGYEYERKEDFDNMIHCYSIGVENGHCLSTYRLMLHYYYDYDERDYENAIKYMDILLRYFNKKISVDILLDLVDYLKETLNFDKVKIYLDVLIDRNLPEGMIEMGYYYEEIKDYKNMEKYYNMALENGCYDAALYLAEYYESIKNYSEMLKYIIIIIENDFNLKICMNIIKYYEKIKDYENMGKYYILAYEYCIKNNIQFDIDEEIHYNFSKRLYNENNILKNQNEELTYENTELKYRPGGPGYEKAMENFYKLANN